jgi:hypothetical protein
MGPEIADSSSPAPVADPYMLWWRIKMQKDEYRAAEEDGENGDPS